jgi:hypothetical protein
MDIPVPVHIDEQGDVETLPPNDSHLTLQARSLRNTLGLIRNKLKDLQKNKIHTFEDVEHYKVALFRLFFFIYRHSLIFILVVLTTILVNINP